MASFCFITHSSSTHDLTSASSRIKWTQTQLNMPLKGIYPPGLSCCSLMSASRDCSAVKWERTLIHTVWLHTIILSVCYPFFKGLFFKIDVINALTFLIFWSGSSAPSLVNEEDGSALLELLWLCNTSPPVMIAVSRSRSLYQRLNNDIKDRLAAYSLSLHTSANSTVNLLRWGKWCCWSTCIECSWDFHFQTC